MQIFFVLLKVLSFQIIQGTFTPTYYYMNTADNSAHNSQKDCSTQNIQTASTSSQCPKATPLNVPKNEHIK